MEKGQPSPSSPNFPTGNGSQVRNQLYQHRCWVGLLLRGPQVKGSECFMDLGAGERVRERDSEWKGTEKWVRVGESVLRVPPPSPRRRFQQRSWREAPKWEHWAKDAEMHRSMASPGKLSPQLQFSSEAAVCWLYTRSVVSEGTFPLWSLQGKAFMTANPGP